MPINLRTAFDENGTKLDVLWFYDTEKNKFMVVLPEDFFCKSKEELAEAIKKINFLSSRYCEFCNKLQHPFREFQQKEPEQPSSNKGFSKFGCMHFSQEEVDALNKKINFKLNTKSLSKKQ